MTISEDTFARLNASAHSVKVPENLGGGRLALFEFIHQIHCVVSKLPNYHWRRVLDEADSGL